MPTLQKPLRAAVIGYRMGAHHASLIAETEGMEVAMVCDLREDRLEAARRDLGQVKTCTEVAEVAAEEQVDLAVVVTPHNVHAECALPCLQAGKHVVVEKPMAITVEECDRMIEAAERAGVSLSVFHNRRWDGQFMTARDLIREGHIGEVFHLETSFAHYREMPEAWRADKEVSGGLFYDWGSHYTDWVLNLMGERRIVGVTGQFQKRVWERPTIEDHVEACLRFDDGAVAHLQISRIAAAEKPRWYILGTDGALLDEREGQTQIFTRLRGHIASFSVDYQDSDWPAYYRGIAAHLTEDAPIPVTPQSARRVIGVFQAAELSSRQGGEHPVPHEQ